MVDGRNRRARPTVVNLVSIAAALVLTASMIDVTLAKEVNANAVTKGEQPMNVMIDVHPGKPHSGTTLVSCLKPLMQTLGHPEWSLARLQGVMGHAFHFEMKEGGGGVMHDHMDWGFALKFLPELGQMQSFDASKHDTDVDLPALKREAREAVRASLAQGIPALVWQPMSIEMKANRQFAFCWGLIVGYNEAEEAYTVRHPYVADDYTIRYDAFGHSDGAEWFSVRIFDTFSTDDEKTTHLKALRRAVVFLNGTRKGNKGNEGFSAYDVWRRAFDSAEVPLEQSRYHTEILRKKRLAAEAHMRELVTLFPKAAEPLEAAAAHFNRELESLSPMYDLCVAAKSRKAWTAKDRPEIQRLIGKALRADQEAVAQIQVALEILDVP